MMDSADYMEKHTGLDGIAGDIPVAVAMTSAPAQGKYERLRDLSGP